MTYYEILEVDQSSGYDEIKKSYRRLVKTYHPDVNPSALAAQRIVELTTAYEVLSDPNARASYDWQLSAAMTSGADFQYRPDPAPKVDEREQRRREYVKWKRQRDQEAWERHFHMRVVFYKYQRYFAFVFLAVGLLFSYDYFIYSSSDVFTIDKVVLTKWGDARVFIGHNRVSTSGQFYYEVQNAGVKEGVVHFSGVFRQPSKISVADHEAHNIHGSLHSFNNFFPYMIILIALGLIVKKKYSDFMLTMGLLPIFMILFLLAFLSTA